MEKECETHEAEYSEATQALTGALEKLINSKGGAELCASAVMEAAVGVGAAFAHRVGMSREEFMLRSAERWGAAVRVGIEKGRGG